MAPFVQNAIVIVYMYIISFFKLLTELLLNVLYYDHGWVNAFVQLRTLSYSVIY